LSKSTFHELRGQAEKLGAAKKEGNEWRVDAEWKPNRASFRVPATAVAAASPEIQNSPISVQTEPCPGSNKSAPKGAGLDWTHPDSSPSNNNP
jgi:hypothetical protein